MAVTRLLAGNMQMDSTSTELVCGYTRNTEDE